MCGGGKKHEQPRWSLAQRIDMPFLAQPLDHLPYLAPLGGTVDLDWKRWRRVREEMCTCVVKLRLFLFEILVSLGT